MAKILQSVCVILFMTLYSCHKDYETMTYFYINNNTKNDIKMIVYNADIFSNGYSKDTAIYITVGGAFNYYVIQKGKNSPSKAPFGVLADSVRIEMNDSNRIEYKQPLRYLDTNKANILNIESYNGGKEKEGLYKYYYSFSDDSFEK